MMSLWSRRSQLQKLPLYEVMVTFQHVGFHCWPKAPETHAYLRNDHRHLFKFVIRLRANHADRDIECHALKQSCEVWAQGALLRRTTKSCEQFSVDLLEFLRRGFEPTWGRVECWEDGEVGGACECEFTELENPGK